MADAPGSAISIACKGPTSERECFKVEELPDRIIFCANTGRYYVFFQERPNELDQHCVSAPRLNAAVTEANELNPNDDTARRLKEIITSNDKLFMEGEKRSCSVEGRAKLDSRVVGIQDVNKVLLDPRLRPGRQPIGIIAGVFCDNVSIGGIDVTRSLVFDYGVFLKSVTLSSIKEAANISFNRASLAQNLTVSRSKIEGGIYLRNAVINSIYLWQSSVGLDIDLSRALVIGRVKVAQTRIDGPVDFSGSTFGQFEFVDNEAGDISLERATFLGSAEINRSKFAGSLYAPSAAFSAIQILYNKFATNVSFQNVGARCGINLSNNTVGNDLTLARFFLGKVVYENDPLLADRTQYRWPDGHTQEIKRRLEEKDVSSSIIKSMANIELRLKLEGLLQLAEYSDCKPNRPDATEAVKINDNRVDKNTCLSELDLSFERPSGGTSGRRVGSIFVSLGGSITQGTTFLSFWPINKRALESAATPSPSYLVDLVGYRTGSLAPDLETEYTREFRLLTTGVQFDRIFANAGACGTEPNSANPINDANLIESAGLKLPEIESLLSWLSRADTTEPYTFAIAAFNRAGADATDLKVQKAHSELAADIREKWNDAIRGWRNDEGFLRWIWLHAFGRLWDSVRWIATGMLGWIADYGYRPQKAILYLVAAIAGFTLWITRRLNVKWAATEVQDRVVPVGWIFVLDRMIPGYNIDEAHFKVREFRFGNGVAIDADTDRRLRRVLRLIKVAGAVAVIFVAAVLKTLVAG